MPDIPPTRYFIADQPDPVQAGNPLWEKRLPLDYLKSKKPPQASLSYGAYFRAISDYIGQIGPTDLAKIASHIADRPINPEAITHLEVHLEKHGAFYHPARLILQVNADRISCVVNVAVSQLGQETIVKEFHNLKRLSSRYANNWLPQVFNCLPVATRGHRDIQIFMGEWFEDYHEFHLSIEKTSENPKIRVWDPRNPNHFLSLEKAQQIFRQAAMILTAHYRLDTTEQIASWHHAAGDFVVCIHSAGLSVKLITARTYDPLFNLNQQDCSLETVLNTALIFFLNMCMKLRIDRIDGVGDIVWNHLDVVPGIIAGFFQGLNIQARDQRISPELIDAIKLFFLNLPEKDVQDTCVDIAGQIKSQSPDRPVVQQNIDTHIASVSHGFRKLTLPL